jgi:hypothetical protein
MVIDKDKSGNWIVKACIEEEEAFLKFLFTACDNECGYHMHTNAPEFFFPNGVPTTFPSSRLHIQEREDQST